MIPGNTDGDGSIAVGIDIGGTFTDIVCRDAAGHVRQMKIPSDRARPAEAVLAALSRMQAEWAVAPDEISQLVHGTTVATNAVLERKGAKVGIITTKGFRDVLEIGRQGREQIYDTVLKPQTPVFLAPRRQRQEVDERVARDGTILTPLDEGDVRRAADQLVAEGCNAIAIAFLFCFSNPAHEIRAAEIIKEAYPEIDISRSSIVDPTFREYERTCATAFDAYVKPVLNRYLEDLETGLQRAGVAAPFQIIQSRGGLCSATVARRRPVRLFLSGPAAGVVGGVHFGAVVNAANLITLDIGGTSSDIALVVDGTPLVRAEGTIDGYPVRVPMVDIHAIGAGGGSIAKIDQGGALTVGPSSAGSNPGPACYGQGGTEPTVTDASLVLGYLDPEQFAGGTMRLDPALAAKAIQDRIADPLGIGLEQAALGIHQVMNAQMAEGIRLVTINRGHDPRDFALVAMGGAGPLHACALAEELGVKRVIVPPRPGVASALGLLSAPTEHEVFRAHPTLISALDPVDVRRVLENLDDEAASLMALDGIKLGASSIRHEADICFVGQAYAVGVPFDSQDDEMAATLYETFLIAHDQLYGHAARAPARLVNLRTIHRVEAQTTRSMVMAAEDGAVPASTQRPILTDGKASHVLATIVQRAGLEPGSMLKGPAIVEQSDTTVLIPQGWLCETTVDGSLVLKHGKNSS